MTKEQRKTMNKMVKEVRENTKMKIDEIKNRVFHSRQEIKSHKTECKRLRQKIDEHFVAYRQLEIKDLIERRKMIETNLKEKISSIKNSFNIMASV